MKIAIVGRPNVGKSALFNRICGKRIAIVDEAEGITRDRLYGKSEIFGRPFEVIDTGGIHAKSEALFNDEILEQAEIAIEEGDALIMVVDGQIGPTDLDLIVARNLLKAGKPLVLAVNKIDAEMHEEKIASFYGLGIKHVVGVSATQDRHIAELLEPLEIPEERSEEEMRTKLAIIGRPNVGKSTLVNCLLDDSRCIVSPIAGTTRDSIDTPFGDYLLIDTAGIRRKKSEHEVVDKFAAIRTKRAIERADVCVLMLDAREGMTTQEKHISNAIEEAGKGCIIFFNKWDLVKSTRMEHLMRQIRDETPFLAHCPIIFGSAETARNLDTLMEQVALVKEERKKRVTTGILNTFMEKTLQKVHPPMLRGKRLRIYYMTQVSNAPPRFILFVNKPDLMAKSYERYIYNRFRETFGFTGNPVVFQLKGKKKRENV